MQFDRLSSRERECLRGVYAKRKAEVIAADLGLSPHTVVNHLRNARSKLGVPSSDVAAQLLFEHEHPETARQLREVLTRIEPDNQPATSDLSYPAAPAAPHIDEVTGQPDGGDGPARRQSRLASVAPFRTDGRTENRLSAGVRLFVMLAALPVIWAVLVRITMSGLADFGAALGGLINLLK